MTRTRISIAVPGILLILFGVFRLLSEIPNADLIQLAIWLIVAVLLHDGVLSPIVVGVGWLVSRVVPPRARAYAQGGLIAGAFVTVIALPMIYRGDVQPASKGILQQNYSVNLLIALVIVAAVALTAYLTAIAKGQRRSSAKPRPADDHDSATE